LQSYSIIAVRTHFVLYFETPSPGQAVCWVFDVDALAFRQKRTVVNWVPISERSYIVRSSRQVQLDRLRVVQVVVNKIDPYTVADWKIRKCILIPHSQVTVVQHYNSVLKSWFYNTSPSPHPVPVSWWRSWDLEV